MDMLFGKKKTPAGKHLPWLCWCHLQFEFCKTVSFIVALLDPELLRENKRMLDKGIRDLDRERMGLQNEEKKIIAEIKKLAKEGQNVSIHMNGVQCRAVILHVWHNFSQQRIKAEYVHFLATSGCCEGAGQVSRP